MQLNRDRLKRKIPIAIPIKVMAKAPIDETQQSAK